MLAHKTRGRPKTTGKGTLIGVRLQSAPLRQVDAWAAQHEDRPSHPEAMRRLIELALTGNTGRKIPVVIATK